MIEKDKVMEKYFLLVIGLICIFAGIFHWPFPSVLLIYRDTKWGEKINTFIMVLIGGAALCVGIWSIIENI